MSRPVPKRSVPQSTTLIRDDSSRALWQLSLVLREISESQPPAHKKGEAPRDAPTQRTLSGGCEEGNGHES